MIKDILNNETSQNEDLDEQINKIRKKTFNDELRSLVNRITSDNERDFGFEEIDKSNLSKKENLLLTIHQLFYKTINLKKIDSINKNFNPFHQKTISKIDSIKNAILKEFKNLGINKFAFLNYSINKKCYLPVLNTLFIENPEYLHLSVTEKIFIKLFDSVKGELINTNYFISKYMDKDSKTIKEQSIENLLIISLNNIIPNLWIKLIRINKKYKKFIIPPLLIINTQSSNKNEMSTKLTSKLNILLYLYFLNLNEDSRSYNTLFRHNDLFHLLDSNRECQYFFIQYQGKFNNQIFIIMKKLYNKLQNSLSEKSNLFYYEKNKIIIFLNINDENIVKKVLYDYNKLYFDLFIIKKCI